LLCLLLFGTLPPCRDTIGWRWPGLYYISNIINHIQGKMLMGQKTGITPSQTMRTREKTPQIEKSQSQGR
jgi:hypothetical protein